MAEAGPQNINFMPIIVFVVLSLVAWRLCKKAGLNPYLSILIFIMAVINQGFGLIAFIAICCFAGFKIIKVNKTKKYENN